MGLSLPLWSDPGPVSVFASSSLNLYSGLISVGVADTAAAVIGKIYSSFRKCVFRKKSFGSLIP